jgi:GTP-binding protein
MLIDEAIVRVRGGRGGNGVISFAPASVDRRRPPDGGRGGEGGAVYLEASSSVSTLHGFRNRPLFAAADGGHGGGNNRQGAAGGDSIVHVPPGTVVRDAQSGETIADLVHEGDRVLVARGGEAGRGNRSFTTSVRQGPRICERGLAGETRHLRLELKLLADVGIVGAPNAGKSTLLSRISGSRPKIADYPFTTVSPNLGVVQVDALHRFIAVDIPGLVEGAHDGRGLGDRFLRHIERTCALIHVVDLATQEDPWGTYCQIRDELRAFNPELASRPELVAGNKVDLLTPEAVRDARRRFISEGIEVLPISASAGKGLDELVQRTFRMLDRERPEHDAKAPRRRVYVAPRSEGFRVERVDDGFAVRGEDVEKLVRKLVLDSRDAQEYLAERLERMGVLGELRGKGLTEGDTVRIGGVELEFER